jgi:hypothetical protein
MISIATKREIKLMKTKNVHDIIQKTKNVFTMVGKTRIWQKLFITKIDDAKLAELKAEARLKYQTIRMHGWD